MCSNLLLGEQQGSTTARTKIATTFRITDRDAFSSRVRNREALLPFDAFHAFSAKRRLWLVSAKKLFSLVLLSDPLPGHGQFFQNTALILRLSLLG